MPKDPLADLFDKPRSARERLLEIARSESIPDDIAEDFSRIINFESGGSHYDRRGKVKLSPPDPKTGERAVGGTQIKPSTARGVGVSNPFDETENIRAGLRYFNQGGTDPVGRRIHYFGGPGALGRYKKTGRIPKGKDVLGTTFEKYVKATGGQQDPIQDLFDKDSIEDLFDKPEAPAQEAPAAQATPGPAVRRQAGATQKPTTISPAFGQQQRPTTISPAFGPRPQQQAVPETVVAPEGLVETQPGQPGQPRTARPVPDINQILTEARGRPDTFTEDRARRAAQQQGQQQAAAELKKRIASRFDQLGDEYKNFLLQNRATDSPRMKNAFLDLKVKQSGDPAQAIAMEDAELARQGRVAQMGLGERLLQVPKSVAIGAASTAGTGLKGVAALKQKMDLFGQFPSTEDVPLYQLGQAFEDKSREWLGSDPDLEQDFLSGRVPHTYGQVATFILGGWAAKSPQLAVAVMGGTVTAGDAYDEVKALGGTEEEALTAAIRAGLLLGPTELLGMQGALRALKGARAATWKATLKEAAREGRKDMLWNSIQEMGQETGQGLITGRGRTGAEIGEAGLLGAIGGTPTIPLTIARRAPIGARRATTTATPETPADDTGPVVSDTGEPLRGDVRPGRGVGERPSVEPVGTGASVESVVQEQQRFYHRDWGEVEVLEDQSGARPGRVKVAEVADPNKLHYPKKSDLRGRGNERMVPIKPEAETPLPPQAPPAPAAPATPPGQVAAETLPPEGEGVPPPSPAIEAAPAEIPGAKKKVEDYFDRLIRKRIIDEAGQARLDEMIDEGVSPEAVNKEFWQDTYWKLSGPVQQHFQRYLQKLTGFKPGDVIATDREGNDIRAKDWIDIAENLDLANEAEYLEGGERGLAVLMYEANEMAKSRPGGEGATRVETKALPAAPAETPSAQVEIPKREEVISESTKGAAVPGAAPSVSERPGILAAGSRFEALDISDPLVPKNIKREAQRRKAEFLVIDQETGKAVKAPTREAAIAAAQAKTPMEVRGIIERARPRETLRPTVTGNEATASTERGTEIKVKYAVVDANDLIASHDQSLNENPEFPQGLQPRQRGRVASAAQIADIASKPRPAELADSAKVSDGAPIVGPDGIVESGNGRVIGLRQGYENNNEGMKKYRQYLLDNAERLGLDRAAIEKVKQPILIRRRTSDVPDRVQFVKEANMASVAAMSVGEQAQSDAGALTGALMERFRPSESGEINTAANRDFIRAFMRDVVGPSEQGRYMTAKGEISQEGINRIRNAVFARAYGDSPAGMRALEKIAESPDNNVRNISSALLMKAGEFASLKEAIEKGSRYPLDITGDLSKAIEKLSGLREQGMTVSDYLDQGALFGEDLTPLQKQILWAFDEYKRSGKAIAGILDNYIRAVEAAGSPQQQGFFTAEAPQKEAFFEAAVREAIDEANKQTDLFTAKDKRAKGKPETGEARSAPDTTVKEGSEVEGRPLSRGPGAAARITRASTGEDFIPVKERKFGKRFVEDERIAEEIRETIGTAKYYEPVPEKLTAANAKKLVDERGIAESMRIIRDEHNNVPFHVRVVMAEIVSLRLNQAYRNLRESSLADAELILSQANETAEFLMEYGTRLGQGVQAFAQWARQTPEGILLTYKKAVRKARQAREKVFTEDVKEIVDTVNKPMTDAERLDALKKLFKTNKTARKVRSEWQRIVKAAKDGKLTDNLFYEIAGEKLGLPTFNQEVAERITKLAEEIEAAPEGIQKNKKIRELMHYIEEQKGFSVVDLPLGIYYANILSGYNTHAVNFGDTGFNVLAEINGLAMVEPRAAAWVYSGLLRGLAEGRLDALKTLTEGRLVTDGKWLERPRLIEIARFGEKGGVPIKPTGRVSAAVKTFAESPLGYPLNAYKYVGRAMMASDALMFRGAKEAKASLLAYKMAKEEGLKGDALHSRVQEILGLRKLEDFRAQAKREGFTGQEIEMRARELREMTRPTDLSSDAAEWAGEATYNHRPHGTLGMFARRTAAASEEFKALKLFVPFTQIVANVTNRGLNYTPYGYKRAYFGWGYGKGREALTPEQRTEMLTRATMGTAGLVLLGGLQAAGLLVIHGNGPSDNEKRRQLLNSGWRPYSLQIGDTYISYIYTPVGLGLSIVGNMSDSQRYHELERQDAATRAAYAVARLGSTVFSQSFLSGLSRLFNALSDEPSRSVSSVKQILSGTVSAFGVPNIVRDVHRLFDNKIYTSNTIMEDLVRNTPFAGLHLKPALNAFGEPVRAQRQRFVDRKTSDPAWRFVIEKNLKVPVPGRTTEVEKGVRITPEQYYELLSATGPKVKNWILANRARLSRMKEQDAQDELRNAASRIRKLELTRLRLQVRRRKAA